MLGAGDAFMSGFLRGWLRRRDRCETARDLGQCLRRLRGVAPALRAGISRPGRSCSSSSSTAARTSALRKDEALNHIHWATTRRRDIPQLMALAIDHRRQLEDMADRPAPTRERIAAFKVLAVKAAAQVADGRPGYGMLLDDNYGREALFDARQARFLDRPAGRAAGLAAAALRVHARTSARSWSNGRSTTASSACASIIPTIRPS